MSKLAIVAVTIALGVVFGISVVSCAEQGANEEVLQGVPPPAWSVGQWQVDYDRVVAAQASPQVTVDEVRNVYGRVNLVFGDKSVFRLGKVSLPLTIISANEKALVCTFTYNDFLKTMTVNKHDGYVSITFAVSDAFEGLLFSKIE